MTIKLRPDTANEIINLGRWLKLELTGQTKRTYRWLVRSEKSGHTLGQISWYAPWRCYVFWPADVVLNAECLTDLAGFLRTAPKVEA